MSQPIAPDVLPHDQPDGTTQAEKRHQQERQQDGSDYGQANVSEAEDEERQEELDPIERLLAAYDRAHGEAEATESDIRSVDADLWRQKKKCGDHNPMSVPNASYAEWQEEISAACADSRNKRKAVDDALAAIKKAEDVDLEDFSMATDELWPYSTKFTRIYPGGMPLYAYDPVELRDPELKSPVHSGARRWCFSNGLSPS